MFGELGFPAGLAFETEIFFGLHGVGLGESNGRSQLFIELVELGNQTTLLVHFACQEQTTRWQLRVGFGNHLILLLWAEVVQKIDHHDGVKCAINHWAATADSKLQIGDAFT